MLGVERIALIYGWSMGGQQALHWGALHPNRVERICATCTSARTSPHNQLFLEGLRAALTADAGWNGAWFNERPLQVRGKYVVRHTTAETRCIVKSIDYKLDINHLEENYEDKEIRMNDVARITIKTTSPLFFDDYLTNNSTGSLILIEEGTNETVAAGMIRSK